MTSPFHEEQGPQKHGDLVYEWRSLLNTPCYGFNGPNACYSPTCSHNPSLSEPEKQLTKQKMPNSSKLSFKFNVRKSSNCERASDHNTYKSSLTSHLTVQMNTFGYARKSIYEKYEQKFNGSGLHYGSIDGRVSDDCSENTIDCNQFYESPDYYCQITDNDSTLAPSIDATDYSDERTSTNSSHEHIVSPKKYAFNPLSEPFHPTRNIYANANSSLESTDCTPIREASDDESEPPMTTLIQPTEPTPTEFVCILCPEKYETLEELQEHILSKVQQPHGCFVCGATFAHSYLLRRHLDNHRSSKTFDCRGCSKKFRSLLQLKKHFELCRYKLYIFF